MQDPTAPIHASANTGFVWRQADRPADAAGRPGRRQPPQGNGHDAAARQGAARAGPGPARFAAERPDELYVADITYVPTWAGFLFLAVVLDACTRRVVGWSMANHLRTGLVLGALNMAASAPAGERDPR